MSFPSESLNRLVSELEKLPGIGPKSAQRLAFHLLKLPQEEVRALSDALRQVKERVGLCGRCLQFCEGGLCDLCADGLRAQDQICVVEQPQDVPAIERTGEFRGVYHVLHGALSPLDGVTPSDLKIAELLARLSSQSVSEVILATNATVEGEATALYLSRLIKPAGVRVTRIVHGLPMGADVEYADEMTLARALSGRRDF